MLLHRLILQSQSFFKTFPRIFIYLNINKSKTIGIFQTHIPNSIYLQKQGLDLITTLIWLCSGCFKIRGRTLLSRLPVKSNYSQPDHKICENIESCHGKSVYISKGLQLVGFGGSVPGYTDLQRTKQKWKGYPFASNDALTQQCQKIKIFDVESQNQKIYLTHCGPFDCETSIDRRNPKQVVYGGAVYFNDLPKHNNLLLYLHGHVHHATRFARTNQIPLINPGGIINGRFGYVCLQRNHQSGKWSYQSSHFIQLQSKEND